MASYLPDRADDRLVGTLGALSGVCTLVFGSVSVSVNTNGGGRTYSAGLKGVTGGAEKLFVGEESSESIWPTFVRNYHRAASLPVDALGTGEQSLHEGRLGADGDIDVAVAHAGSLVGVVQILDAANGILGIGIGSKLHIALVGLARGTVHDDVDRPA